jgi:hypothetical protein
VPIMMERPIVDRAAECAERVPIPVVRPGPILENNAEFIGCVCGVDEIALIGTEETQEIQDRGNSGFAYPHDRHFG